MRFNKLALIMLMATPFTLVGSNAHSTDFSAQLLGFDETPVALFSNGSGRIDLTLNTRTRTITYRLTYSGLTSPVTQSHIHFGKEHVTGGITVFFCTNLGNGPAGTQACPSAGGTIMGTITAGDVLAVGAQNMPAGDFDALVRLFTTETAYANVHSTMFPAGEIRGQIRVAEPGGIFGGAPFTEAPQ
jgi:hypothetical protein